MSYQNNCFLFKMVQKNVFKYLLLDISVEGRDWIVQENHFSVSIDSSRERNSSFLSSAQVDSFLSDFGLIFVGQYL